MPPDSAGAPTQGTGIAKSVLQFSVPAWFAFVINIVSAIIITRQLQPDAYGLLNTFQASTTLFVFLVCVGLDNGFLRYFFESPAGFDKHGLLFVCLLAPLFVLGVTGAAVLPFCSGGVARLLFSVDNGVLAFLLLVNAAANVLTRFLTVYYRMDGNALFYGVLSVSLQLALKGSVVIAAMFRPDYETVVWASVVGVVIVATGFLYLNRRSLFPPEMLYSFRALGRLKELLLYSAYTWPVPVLLYLHVVLTQIIVRLKLGNDAVGLLTSVSVFVGVVSAFQAGFATFWSGYMYRNYQTQAGRITRMHDYLALFVIVSMAGFVLFRDLMFPLLGRQYQATKPFFALLLLYPLLFILSETTAYGIGIARKSHLMFVVTFASVVVNVVITWALVPRWGLLGACAGSVVSGVVLFAGQSYFGQKYFRSIGTVWRTVFAVACLLVFSIGNLVYTDRPLSRAGLSIVGLGVAVAAYWKASGEILGLAKGLLNNSR